MTLDPGMLAIASIAVALVAIVVALQYRISPLTLFFVALPFPMSVIGEGSAGNISLSDMVMAVALLTVLGRNRQRLGLAGLMVVVYLFVVGLSSTLSDSFGNMALGLGRMALVTLVPLFVFANLNEPVQQLRQGFVGYCLSAAVLACCTLITFALFGIDACMYTFNINKNGLGSFFGTAVVIIVAALATDSVGKKRARLLAAYAVLALCSMGLLIVLSRGAWVGAAAGLLVVLALTGRSRRALIAAVLVGPILAGLWSLVPADRVEYATNITTDAHTMQTRFDTIDIVMNAFRANPVLGVGIGLRREVEPHNMFVQALGETGIAGLIGFVFMIGVGAKTLWKGVWQLAPKNPDRAVLITGLAIFVVFHVHALIDVYWRRGDGAFSWICVGVAVAVLQTERRSVRKTGRLVALPAYRPRAIRSGI